MTENPVPPEECADLEYDLAHDGGAERGPRQPAPQTDARPVATATPEYDAGDYSYDQAHDVPGR